MARPRTLLLQRAADPPNQLSIMQGAPVIANRPRRGSLCYLREKVRSLCRSTRTSRPVSSKDKLGPDRPQDTSRSAPQVVSTSGLIGKPRTLPGTPNNKTDFDNAASGDGSKSTTEHTPSNAPSMIRSHSSSASFDLDSGGPPPTSCCPRVSAVGRRRASSSAPEASRCSEIQPAEESIQPSDPNTRKVMRGMIWRDGGFAPPPEFTSYNEAELSQSAAKRSGAAGAWRMRNTRPVYSSTDTHLGL